MLRNKSVSFATDEALCDYYHAGQAVSDVMHECSRGVWYNQAEMSLIKRKTMVLCKDSSRRGLGDILTNTYGTQGEETQDALNAWAINGGARRGLERWINDEYAARRADIRQRTIRSVLRAQEKMRKEGVKDVEYGVKVLARLSETFSLDSRNFACSFGVADEVAAMDRSGDAERSISSKERKFLEDEMPANPIPRQLKPSKRSFGIPRSGSPEFRHFY